MSVVYALDTGAVLRLLDGDARLARLLYDASAHDYTAAVPVTCLLEAASRIEAAGGSRGGLLAALRAPVLRVTPAPDPGLAIVRAATGYLGPIGLAHAAIEALVHRCRLVTTRPADVWPVGLADWQLIPV
jgi:hypothetical protein